MAELQDILQQINSLKDSPEPYLLKKLIDSLRCEITGKDKDKEATNKNIKHLNEILDNHPDYANGLAVFILTLLNKYHRMSLYTDTGIFSDHSFSNSLMRLVGHRFIPLLPEDDSIVELIAYLFDGKNDEQWLENIDETLWDELIERVKVDADHYNLVATAKNNILNAMVILSYRINGIGLHPDLMKAYPQMIDYSASFVAQNQEAVLFANQYREAHHLDEQLDVMPENDIDPGPLLVMIEQCDGIVSNVRKRIYKTGISIRLTNMLLRLEQSLQRMRVLSELLADNHHNRDKAIIELTQSIIFSVKRRYSIGYLISNNTKLLSRKITENSSRVGEHYISTDREGYKKMFKMAAIGGFVIAFMATIKILSYDLDLAPMSRAFVNSMIYGLGFVFIHIIHGTVATKQPAMTAAAIASTISDSSGKKSQKLSKLSELMVDIMRTQFIAIMGNVLIAMPLALIISLVWLLVNGQPMISMDKAEHLIHDLDPLHSLALFHAAIAGVYLFLAGLIAGYYDNLAVFNNIGERIAKHKYLLKVLPRRWPERLGRFIEGNLGAIMGNFLFGVFLGSTATFGYIFGLPLDIRHIAFASANLAHGLFNTPVDSFSAGLVLLSLLGVALIGIVNLMVSFSLAMIVALRSKGVRVVEWKTLSKLMWNHLITQPRDFFLPRPNPMHYTYIDNHGHMIHQDSSKPNDGTNESSNLTVRRLSDIQVMPKGIGIDSKRIEALNEKNAFIDTLTDPDTEDNSSVTEKKDVILEETVQEADLDNKGSIETGESNVGATCNSEVNSASDSSSIETGHYETDDPTRLTGKHELIKNAKTPLPKPKNPPQLPD